MFRKLIAGIILANALIGTKCAVLAAELPDSVAITCGVTAEEEDAILRVAMAEAGNQGVDGMRYVISTILNRVASPSPDFEDTILGVINHPWQFTTSYRGPISDECRDALELELQEQIDTEILWFSSAGWPAYGQQAFKYKDHWFTRR